MKLRNLRKSLVNSISRKQIMSKEQKRRDAWSLFYESVLKPDSDLRQQAHEQECFYELMEWREEILEHLQRAKGREFGE